MKYSVKENILYLDNHLLALNKLAPMLTQPAQQGVENLEALAKAYLKERFAKSGDVFLHPIHRLDKQVKGIVLFARTSKALSRLQKDMREKKISRSYIAIVEGLVVREERTLENYLVHDSHRSILATKEQKEAKLATLSYKVLQKEEGRTHLKIDLVTGRYHQIRAQLSSIGHPILGDEKYGSSVSSETFCLQHARMEFIHPVSKETCILIL